MPQLGSLRRKQMCPRRTMRKKSFKLLNLLKIRTAGIDGLPDKIIKFSILVYLCNLSSTEGRFPERLKEKQITSTGLHELITNVLNAMDTGKSSLGVFLDLSKAFDVVNYNLLLHKLRKHGITGNANKWLHSHLKGRSQVVVIPHLHNSTNYRAEYKLDERAIEMGVPQGSIMCQKVLEALGVSSVTSPGEAEAMCAYLNDAMVVDGCISQDSDCFLYGAKTVYRNFSAACSSKGAGFAVDSYDMLRIQERLGFDREGLVALALLCGCDYQDGSQIGTRGVAGIGIEKASQLIIGLSKMFGNPLSRLGYAMHKLPHQKLIVFLSPVILSCQMLMNLVRHQVNSYKPCQCFDDQVTHSMSICCPIDNEQDAYCSFGDWLKSWKSDPYYCKLEEDVVAVESGPICILCGHRGSLGRHDRVGCKSCNFKEGCKMNSALPIENSLLRMSLEKRKLLVLELNVRAKALAYSGFPSQAIIDEFLDPMPCHVPVKPNDISWNQPNLKYFLEIAEKYLGWSQEYSLVKFLPLLTRWKVMQEREAQNVIHPNDVRPSSIKKKRVSKGVHCFEVEWNIVPEVLETNVFSTLEPVSLFERAYPSLSQEFLCKKGKGQIKLKNGGGGKSKITNKANKGCNCSGSKNGHICQFFDKKSNDDSNSKTCGNLSYAINSVTEMLENTSIKNHSSSSDEEHVSDLDDFDPLELSAIINGIVEGNSSSHKDHGVGRKEDLVTKYKVNHPGISRLTNDDADKPLPSEVEYAKETECNIAETCVIDKDMKMLCWQFEHVGLERISERDKPDENITDDLLTVNPLMKGQPFEPNFDLGMSALLLSPEIPIASKSIVNSSP